MPRADNSIPSLPFWHAYILSMQTIWPLQHTTLLFSRHALHYGANSFNSGCNVVSNIYYKLVLISVCPIVKVLHVTPHRMPMCSRWRGCTCPSGIHWRFLPFGNPSALLRWFIEPVVWVCWVVYSTSLHSIAGITNCRMVAKVFFGYSNAESGLLATLISYNWKLPFLRYSSLVHLGQYEYYCIIIIVIYTSLLNTPFVIWLVDFYCTI